MFGIWGKQATDLSGVCAWGVAKSASFVCVVQFTGKDVLAQYCQLSVVFYFLFFFGPGGFSAHPKVPAGYPGERFGQIIYSSEGLCWVASGDLPLREPFATGTPLSDLP